MAGQSPRREVSVVQKMGAQVQLSAPSCGMYASYSGISSGTCACLFTSQPCCSAPAGRCISHFPSLSHHFSITFRSHLDLVCGNRTCRTHVDAYLMHRLTLGVFVCAGFAARARGQQRNGRTPFPVATRMVEPS